MNISFHSHEAQAERCSNTKMTFLQHKFVKLTSDILNHKRIADETMTRADTMAKQRPLFFE